MAYGVYSYLDISTAHIPDSLLNGESDYRIVKYPEGTFFFVPYDPEEYPAVIADVCKYAAEHNCVIIRFDADGLEFPEFPTYDKE